MLDELNAALAAAESYVVRNEGEEPHVKFIQDALKDALAHAQGLEDYFNGHEQAMAVHEAQNAAKAAATALAAAQAGVVPGPTIVTPDAPAVAPAESA